MLEQVEIVQSSISRSWRRCGGDDTWLLLRTKTGSVADFAAAVERANEAAAARGDGDEAFGAFPSSTPRGFAVQLVYGLTLPAVRRWVADLAESLEAAGFTGKLGGAPDVSPVPYMASGMPPVPTGHVAWTLDLSTPMRDAFTDGGAWVVSPDATARIADLCDRWARRPDAEMVLSQNGYLIAVRLADASVPLARSVTESGLAGLDFRIRSRQVVLHTALAHGGEGVFQVIDDALDWRERTGLLVEALTALPADTNHAYIRPAIRNRISHNSIHVPLPLPPDIEESDVRYNKHLLDRYLPDAHGMQVVRTAHLDRAHDLSDWQITDLGSGRHLVEAHDLDPWFASTLPDPDTLAAARADFAGAILTKTVIADNPAPWNWRSSPA